MIIEVDGTVDAEVNDLIARFPNVLDSTVIAAI